MPKKYDFENAELVIPPKDPNKTRICIRLDTNVLNWFRERVHEAGGGNYQTMINNALKEYITHRSYISEIATTNIIETATITGSLTVSTGILPMVQEMEVLVKEGYILDVKADYLTPNKEKDEEKRYSFAA